VSVAPIKVVVLGLSLSSSWGNGHATTYRALLKAFVARGHEVTFLERDVPWYSGPHRDLADPDWCRLVFYRETADLERHRELIAGADAVIVGSYVPDGVAVGRLVQSWARGATAFYDIDTPVTLAKLARGDFEYVSPDLIPGYDVYLSFTGGPTLDLIEQRYGSPAARALYCSVDPAAYPPLERPRRWDLSYLGTYSPDRQPVLERLLIEPARRLPDLRFVVAGPQYPDDIAWPANVERFQHVGPVDHPEFYAASRYTLNVTRADMVAAGWSPSVRLFEAASCSTPVISDIWSGIEDVLTPGREILLASSSDQVIEILRDPDGERPARIGEAARERILSAHTADCRAAELERYLAEAMGGRDGAAGSRPREAVAV
jgi:spore maturation protein CgeB